MARIEKAVAGSPTLLITEIARDGEEESVRRACSSENLTYQNSALVRENTYVWTVDKTAFDDNGVHATVSGCRISCMPQINSSVEYEWRRELNDEVHARPPDSMRTPSSICYIARLPKRDPLSGEGIRPAVESGLMAADAILRAEGDFRRERLAALFSIISINATGNAILAFTDLEN